MKERNLKDGLDQIPQPFDRDALWERIAEEKPERRRPVFWLWLLPALLAVGVVALLWSQRLDGAEKGSAAAAQLEVPPAVGTQATESTQEAAAPPATISSELSRPDDEINKNQLTTTARDYGNNTETAPQSTIIEPEENAKITVSTKSQSDRVMQEVTSSLVPYTPPSSRLTIKTDRVARSGADARALPADGAVLAFERPDTVQVYSIASRDMEELQLPINLQGVKSGFADVPAVSSQSQLFPWVVTIGSTYGKEQHQFTAADPIGAETELEAIGLRLQVGRDIGKWRLGVGVSYTRGNTMLEHSTTTTNYIPALARAVREVESTRYKLFNTYSRTDVFLDASYGLALTDRFELRPSLGFGTGLLASADGHYFGTDGTMQELSSAASYGRRLGFFGTAGLNVDYRISRQLSLGLGLHMQTVRRYTDEHSIKPWSLEVLTCYRW